MRRAATPSVLAISERAATGAAGRSAEEVPWTCRAALSRWGGAYGPRRVGARSRSALDLAQSLAGLETDRLARSDLDFDSGLRVATDAAFAVAHFEDAEAA
jgi:hypothetical protein